MRIAILDCHKNRTQESKKIANALGMRNNVEIDILEVRKFQFPEKYYSAIVISGADTPTSRHTWVRKTRGFIEEVIRQRTPVLGICYGSQLLAEIFGNEVYALKNPEVGWTNIKLTERGRIDPLFNGLPDSFPVFQYHKRAVNISNGAVLAKSKICVQAATYADKVYGVQFHAEETPESGTEFLQNDTRYWDFEQATRLRPTKYIEWKIFRNFVEIASRLRKSFIC